VQQVEIRVKGGLGQSWSDWFDGFSIAQTDGETLLAGPVRDLAALYGLLDKMSALGLQLLSVTVTEALPGRQGG
jgi:hypothetical protein